MDKRRSVLIKITLIVIAILCVLGVGFRIVEKKNLSWSTGRCIVSDSGSYLLVVQSSPIEMHNRVNYGKMFDGLQTGDKILILHDWILESYPAQTGVYVCLRLEEGNESDIPVQTMQSLQELGWVTWGE